VHTQQASARAIAFAQFLDMRFHKMGFWWCEGRKYAMALPSPLAEAKKLRQNIMKEFWEMVHQPEGSVR
jgi:hypothetical protein